MVTVIYEGRDPVETSADASGDDLWVALGDLTSAANWELKPEGMCRDAICIPLPDADRDHFVRRGDRGEQFNLTAFARLIEQPVARTVAGDAWYIGAPSWEWRSRLGSREAPDFTLPDFQGVPHGLSDYRGKKVFLLCWASWCSCRLDLRIWQKLREELKDRDFEVITVACESKGADAARPFVEAASAQHPSLLDERHLVPELYNTRNVPAAFWIDEEGRIVRANDPIYAERRNFKTGEAVRNDRYLDAVRDWVERGPKSRFVQDDGGVGAAMGNQTWDDVQAAAHFRLGVYLHSQGREDETTQQMKQAQALRPENWNYKRQAWNLGNIEDYGYANVMEAIRDPAAPQFYRQVDIVNG